MIYISKLFSIGFYMKVIVLAVLIADMTLLKKFKKN